MKAKIAVPVVAVLLLLSSVVSHASRRVYKDSFLPPNNLRIAVGSKADKGIDRQKFDQVLDVVQAIYGPIVAARGGTLDIQRLWDDDTVNAAAERVGTSYVLYMYGGLARHHSITQDGFALVACHEMGHHLGGAPKIGGTSWASNEGQADYFANLKCLRRVFRSPGADSFTRLQTSAATSHDEDLARAACFSNPADQANCLRGSIAALSVTELLRELGGGPEIHFDTPDPSVVPEMDDSHPKAQCRLDTYFQGSLCPKLYTEDVGETDPAVGTCTKSHGFSIGMRPLCWYKPPATEPAPFSRVAAVVGQTAVKEPSSLSRLKNQDLWKGL